MKTRILEHHYYFVFPRGGEQIMQHLVTDAGLSVRMVYPTLLFFDANPIQASDLAKKCAVISRFGQAIGMIDQLDESTTSTDRFELLDELIDEVLKHGLVKTVPQKVIVKASSGMNIHEKITASRIRHRLEDAPLPDGNGFFRVQMTDRMIWCGFDVSDQVLYQRLSPARGKAALKENLAALVAATITFDKQESGAPSFESMPSSDIQLIIDPMCGSGTLLFETLAHVGGLKPPVPRGFDMNLLPDGGPLAEANSLPQRQLNLRGVGYDADPGAIRAASQNLNVFCQWAGPLPVHLERRDLGPVTSNRVDWPVPSHGRAWIVMNPPYGQRLGHHLNLTFLYQAIGQKLKYYAQVVEDVDGPAPGYTIMAGDTHLLDALGLDYDHQVKLYNGADPVFVRTGKVSPAKPLLKGPLRPQAWSDDIDQTLFVEDLARRLLKNYKKLEPFLNKPWPAHVKGLPATLVQSLPKDVEEYPALRLYRLYNADIPEYNCAIDVYEHCVYLQEYKAPASIDPGKAAHRLEQIRYTVSVVLRLPMPRIRSRSRVQQKGQMQYQRQTRVLQRDSQKQPLDEWHRHKHVFVMQEWGASFIVNLGDYLDTGLFLDHRRLRWLIRHIAAHKHVLNLFSYTGAFSVHAASGGAASTTSVDLSATYTAWAEHNLIVNGLGLERHHVIRADVISWLASHSYQYDIIVIDPPTFSNSKKADDFVVQRDHESLIRQAMRHLHPGGWLFFSCNMKGFTLAPGLDQDFAVQCIDSVTQSPDFLGKTGPNQTGGHRCWLLSYMNSDSTNG